MYTFVGLLLVFGISAVKGEIDCTLLPETGMCLAYFPSYFYNITTDQCEEFVYGGCGGNSNRFPSKKECELVCQSRDDVDCTAPPVVGLCKAAIPRVYYDSHSRECKKFIYGGCGGNTNNFHSVEDCENRCSVGTPEVKIADCDSKADPGLCQAIIPRFFYNTESGQCEHFVYGGCGGNLNNYQTVDECKKVCEKPQAKREIDCSSPAETGLCRGYFPSFFFNAESGRCEEFIYGGCGGNNNIYATEEECQATCARPPVQKRAATEEVDCTSPAVTGFCKAYFPSYNFNPETGECEFFVYGGCGGNNNRYASKERCEATCARPPVEKRAAKGEVDCTSPPVTGRCEAYFPSYNFNPKTGECEFFVYGGCGGNNNRYATEEQCAATCAKRDEVDCTSPPVTGRCDAYFPSYNFNPKTGECEFFVYGGCGGNNNKYATKEQCEATCARRDEVDCAAPPEVGLCQAIIPRYYHDPESRECRKFIYGGCGGNSNNFRSKEDCEKRCSVAPVEKREATEEVDCASPAETGLCRAYFPSYNFNPKTRECEFFVYGGCDGNNNRYATKEECEATCIQPVDCRSEPRTGLCREFQTKFYFDRHTGSCKTFTYGGCGGNNNRFTSEKECEDSCLM